MNIPKLWSNLLERKARFVPLAVVGATMLAVLMVWAIAVFLVLDKRQSLIEEKRQVLERIGSAINSEVLQYFKVIEVFLNDADNWCSKNPDSDPRFDEDFNRLLASFQENTHHQIDIRLLDESGGLYFPPAKSEKPLDDDSRRDFFIAASDPQRREIFIGSPFLGKVIKRWLVPIALPLHAKPHGISVITAVIPLKTLEETFEASRDKPNGSIALFTRDGILVARSPWTESLIGKRVATAGSVMELVRQKTRGDVIRVGDIDGKTRLLSYEAMQDFPLITVVTASVDDIIAASYGFSASVALIALALTLLLTAHALRSLQRIRVRAAQLRAMAADLTTAEERERHEIGQDLHDGLSQILAVAKLKLSALDHSDQGTAGAGALKEKLGSIEALIDQANQEVRSLSLQLSPPVLQELGLVPALRWLAEEMQHSYGLRVNVHDDGLPKYLDQTMLKAVFRATRELLINVAKHAQVDAADVTVARAEDRLILSVTDAGVGFDAHDISKPSAQGGYGLFTVRERIEFMGGDVQIDSTRGDGTVVVLSVALANPEAAA